MLKFAAKKSSQMTIVYIYIHRSSLNISFFKNMNNLNVFFFLLLDNKYEDINEKGCLQQKLKLKVGCKS